MSDLTDAISLLAAHLALCLSDGTDVTIPGLGTFLRTENDRRLSFEFDPKVLEKISGATSFNTGQDLPAPSNASLLSLINAFAESRAGSRSIPTYFDNYINWLTADENVRFFDSCKSKCDDLAIPILLQIARQNTPRFQSYAARRATWSQLIEQGLMTSEKLLIGSEIPDAVMAKSQGGDECYTWRGIPTYKSVFDICIYARLLWDLKPKTIIELGTGFGGSSALFSDLIAGYGLDCKIVSLDRNRPDVRFDNVHFLNVDISKISASSLNTSMADFSHPWIIIEDAHCCVADVLLYFDRCATAGDYLIVEDSISKSQDIEEFLRRATAAYVVDGKYTDMFGWNSTSAVDAIFMNQGILTGGEHS